MMLAIALALGAGQGGARAPSGTHFLSWDNDTATVNIQWDDSNGNPKYMVWDI